MNIIDYFWYVKKSDIGVAVKAAPFLCFTIERG